MSYQSRTTPFPHQSGGKGQHTSAPGHALFWEQGTGKTKEVIDQAGTLFDAGEIDGLLVVAPEGVHLAWVVDELASHLDVSILPNGLAWYSQGWDTRDRKEQVARLFGYKGLSVLAMGFGALTTDRGVALAHEFLTTRRCMVAIDESSYIQTAGAKRTRMLTGISNRRGLAHLAAYRRIMNGTPVDKWPLNLYSQMRALDPDFWRHHGISTYAAFESEFAEFRVLPNQPHVKIVTKFKNLEALKGLITPHSSRVTKDVLGLPPKVYRKRYIELSKQQWHHYVALRDEFVTVMASGNELNAEAIVARLSRLQEVACGYLAEETIPGPNPRLEATVEDVLGNERSSIVWCRYRRAVDDVVAALRAEKIEAVGHHGAMDPPTRQEAIRRFKSGASQVFVATQASAGTGLTLLTPRHTTLEVYHSNTFRLSDRLQSEDRPYRIGTSLSVTVSDIVARNTVDGRLIKVLRDKRDISGEVLGDKWKEWI